MEVCILPTEGGPNGVPTLKTPCYLIHNHPTTVPPFLKFLRYKTAQILTFNAMSESRSIHIDYQVVSQLADLSQDDQSLLNQAIEASKLAYAPYSNFHVGCALRLPTARSSMAQTKKMPPTLYANALNVEHWDMLLQSIPTLPW